MTSKRRRHESAYAALWAAALLGCGKGTPDKPPTVARSAPTKTAAPQAVSPAGPTVSPNPAAATGTPASTSAAGTSTNSATTGTATAAGTTAFPAPPPLSLPVPALFRGEDQDTDAPIPIEIQQELEWVNIEILPRAMELAVYPHPKVRERAAWHLRFADGKLRPQAISLLRGLLRDPISKVRISAADTLQEFQRNALPALPELASLIDDPHEGVRWKALLVIENLGPDALPALPRLLSALRHADSSRRMQVVRAIGMIGPAAREAVPDLLRGSSEYYGDVAVALGRIGADAELLAGLSRPDGTDRKASAAGAGFLAKPSPAIVEKLRSMAIEDAYERARRDAVESLGRIRPTTPEISAALVKATRDEAGANRREAVKALGKCEPKFDEAIPALLYAIGEDPNEDVRKAAAEAIGAYPGAAELRLTAIIDQVVRDGETTYFDGNGAAFRAGGNEFFPLLEAIAKNPAQDEVRRAIALFGMSYIVFDGSRNTPDLRRERTLDTARRLMEGKESATVRCGAASLLSTWGRMSDPRFAPSWLDGLKDGKFLPDRISAADRLADAKNPAALPILVAILSESDPRMVYRAAMALRQYGSLAANAQQKLIELAGRPNPKGRYDRNDFIRTIGLIGARPDLAVPFLGKLLDEDESDFYGDAAESLAEVIVANDLDPKPLLSRAEVAFESKNNRRGDMLKAIGKLGAKGAPAVPWIRAVLQSKENSDVDLRSYSIEALGGIGPGAASAVPELIEAANSLEDPSRVFEAIGKVPAAGPEFAKLVPKFFMNARTQIYVLNTLKELGVHGKDAIPAVLPILKSRAAIDRWTALNVLESMGPAAKAAVPAAKKMVIEDPDNLVRYSAMQMLKATAPDDPEVLGLMVVDADRNRGWGADGPVGKLGKDGAKYVAAGLESSQVEVRRSALNLVPLFLTPPQAVAAYEKAVSDADPQVRRIAAAKACVAGRAGPAVRKALIESLTGKDKPDYETSRALDQLGRAVAPELIAVLLAENTPYEGRRVATSALRHGGLSPHGLRTAVAPALRSENPTVRIWAAAALADQPSLRSVVLPILVENLRGTDPERRQAALFAAGSIRNLNAEDEPVDVPLGEAQLALLELVAGDDPETAQAALDVIGYGNFSPQVEAKLPTLTRRPEQRDTLLQLLQNASEAAPPELTTWLVDGLKNADDNQRRNSYVNALSRQGARGRQALLNLFADPKGAKELRFAAGRGLASNETWNGAELARVERQLADETPGISGLAALILVRGGAPREPLQAQVIELLKGDTDLTYTAREALRKRPGQANIPLAPLFEIAASPDAGGRFFAVGLIAEGAETEADRKKLLDLILDEPQAHVRENLAQHALSDPTGKRSVIRPQDFDGADGERLVRLIALLRATPYHSVNTRKGIAAEFAPKLEPLSAQPGELGLQAALTLVLLGGKSEAAAGRIVAALDTKTLEGETAEAARQERYRLLEALERLGPQGAAAVPKLIALLDDREYAGQARQALAAIGPAAAPAVPKLAAGLADPQEYWQAIHVLAQLGPTAGEAVPPLVEMLDSDLPQRVFQATRALAAIRPQAALDVLTKQAADPQRRYLALEALEKLGKEAGPAVPLWVAALTGKDEEAKRIAVSALREACKSPAAQEAVEPLRALLADPDPDLVGSTARVLGNIGARPEVVVPALVRLLDPPNDGVRQAAVGALEEFGPAATAAVDPLNRLLSAPRPPYGVCRALAKISPTAAVPVLAKLIARPAGPSRSNDPRVEAVHALGELGPAAEAAVPALEKLAASDSDRHLKEAAARAIERIRAQPAAAEK